MWRVGRESKLQLMAFWGESLDKENENSGSVGNRHVLRIKDDLICGTVV